MPPPLRDPIPLSAFGLDFRPFERQYVPLLPTPISGYVNSLATNDDRTPCVDMYAAVRLVAEGRTLPLHCV